MSERGFKTITLQQMREMNVSTLDPRPKIVFVNRREAFKPYKESLDKYLELMRKYKDHPRQQEIALRAGYVRDREGNIRTDRRTRQPLWGSIYESRYRMKITRSGEALKQLRRLAGQSRDGVILMVSDKPRPDASILVDIAQQMMNAEVW